MKQRFLAACGLLLIIAAFALCAGALLHGQTKPTAPAKKSAQKAPPREHYDPDNLGPGEVGCGNHHAKVDSGCKCMTHRRAIQETQRAKCEGLFGEARMECASKIESCPVVPDVDEVNRDFYQSTGSENAPMTAQCKRSCSKAKCQCCKT